MTTNRHFTFALWMPIRLSATTLASLNGCGGPWWDMSRRALNLLEDILSACYKCTLSAIAQKLMFPDTCLYGHFFWFWYVELVPKVCPHLSLTICTNTIITTTTSPLSFARYSLSLLPFWFLNFIHLTTKFKCYHKQFDQMAIFPKEPTTLELCRCKILY
jgi:hypothetical protein